MGLYTPTILGGNSYLSWFYDRGAIKDPAHMGTMKGLSQAINRGPIRKFLPKYANVYVTIQSHGLSAGARTHYVTANGVRNGLSHPGPCIARLFTTCLGHIHNPGLLHQGARFPEVPPKETVVKVRPASVRPDLYIDESV